MNYPEWRRENFILPAQISGHPLRSICFDIPDVAEYRQAFWGHLWEFGSNYLWQKTSTADQRDQEAAAYWREILYTNYQRWLNFEECAADTCRDYPPSAGFIEWFPNNPYLSPDEVGDGYNNPAWYLATTASNLAYGTSFGDAITSIDRFPPGSLPTVIPASGLPRFRINVIGAGTVKAQLVNLFGGSLVQTTMDDDIGTIKFTDVSRDTISAPPETQDELILEFEFTTPGAHHIDFIVISWVNSSIPFLHHGGGLRKVELCGFETMPVVTPPFRFTEGCGLEFYNGEEWLVVDGWSEFAPACFTGAPGTNGVDGIDGVDGSDAPATIVRSNPAGFGNMQQNIAAAGYTDIALSDFLRRDGAFPMTGGLEIEGATDEIKLAIRGVGSPYQTQKLVVFKDANNVEKAWINPRGDAVFTGAAATIPVALSLLQGSLRLDNETRVIWKNAAGNERYAVYADSTIGMFFQSETGTYQWNKYQSDNMMQLTGGALIVKNNVANGFSQVRIQPGLLQSTVRLLQINSSTAEYFNVRSDGLVDEHANDAGTNTVTDNLKLNHQSSATPAAGFGAGLRLQAKSSTTAAQELARLYAVWEDATHATRKSQMVLSAYDTAEREILRGGASGTAPKIGVLGATPSIRLALGAIDAAGNEAAYQALLALQTFGFVSGTFTLGTAPGGGAAESLFLPTPDPLPAINSQTDERICSAAANLAAFAGAWAGWNIACSDQPAVTDSELEYLRALTTDAFAGTVVASSYLSAAPATILDKAHTWYIIYGADASVGGVDTENCALFANDQFTINAIAQTLHDFTVFDQATLDAVVQTFVDLGGDYGELVADAMVILPYEFWVRQFWVGLQATNEDCGLLPPSTWAHTEQWSIDDWSGVSQSAGAWTYAAGYHTSGYGSNCILTIPYSILELEVTFDPGRNDLGVTIFPTFEIEDIATGQIDNYTLSTWSQATHDWSAGVYPRGSEGVILKCLSTADTSGAFLQCSVTGYGTEVPN